MITKKKMWLIVLIILAVNVFVIAGILYFSNKKMEQAYLAEQPQAADELLPDDLTDAAERNANEYEDNMSGAEDTNAEDIDALRSVPPAESYNNVYSSLLIGDYVAEDGTAFRFASDNSYAGYFNEDAPDVENYSYEIVNVSEAENIVTIYSADKRSEVKYSLDLDMEGNVILAIPDTETKYTLCYDGMAYKGDKPTETDKEEIQEESAAEDEGDESEND